MSSLDYLISYDGMTNSAEPALNAPFGAIHYENTPIQIYWNFYHQKTENFR